VSTGLLAFLSIVACNLPLVIFAYFEEIKYGNILNSVKPVKTLVKRYIFRAAD